MPNNPTALRTRRTFCPEVQGLEGRALMAIGQITMSFIPAGNAPAITGELAGGLVNVLDFNVGALNSPTITSTGATTGKVVFDPLVIRLAIGKQTPGLFHYTASGAHFTKAQIVVRDDAARVLGTYTFGTVFVAHQTLAVSNGDTIGNESDTFSFGSLQVTINDPATGLTIGQNTWSQITNSAVLTAQGFHTPAVSTSDVTALASTKPGVSTGAAVLTPTTVSLAATKAGTATRLTATVRATSGTPTGIVAFYNGKTALGTATVGADGTASVTIPGKLAKSKLFALYSGRADSTFAQSSSVTANKSAAMKLFQRLFDRPMNADEWTLTSLWLQQGLTLSKLAATYKRLAARN